MFPCDHPSHCARAEQQLLNSTHQFRREMFKKNFFFWLCQVLAVASGLFVASQRVFRCSAGAQQLWVPV